MVAFSQKDGVKIKRRKFNYEGLKGNFQDGSLVFRIRRTKGGRIS